MADDNDERGTNGRFDPHDPENTAAHRLGPPIRPMRPGAPRGIGADDTGFIDRVTDDGAPVDVAAVRRDDDLIEALAAGGAVTTADQSEFALASLLADWRDEIVTTPVPAGPTVDELLAATEPARRTRGFRPARPSTPPPAPAVGAPSGDGAGDVTPIGDAPSRRGRRFGLVAGAAAAAVAILGGGTVLVNSASPGDGALWSVKEVVFSDAASQTIATSEAKAQLESANNAIESSNQAEAQAALVSARQQAAKVKNEKDRAALEERIRAAEARAGLPVGSTDLPTSTRPTSPSASVPPTSTTEPTVTIPTEPTRPTYPTRPTTPTTTTPDPTSTTPTTTTPTTTTPTTTTPTTTTTTAPTTTTTTPRPRPTATTTTAASASVLTIVPEEWLPR
ncbi:anti-sigma-D factor RsdA [Tsukamurella tyrosinosolvens]|uniref:anti-sigma-D factor RsdA n=1 Tax=Tsukamurella tyrosinosolvens TaxID=57704 RepID=UPI002DD4256C|nr:anti-sigma-D factor RsdA [Tsukamurella tyrosinosolvens]MEC4612059.1 anti-sigma-D factor RsdA [Tsukamurella tyrosinosolvens]